MRFNLKKGMSIILVILMVLGGLNGLLIGGDKVYAAVAFAGGTGTIADPYQIATAAQLNELRNHLQDGDNNYKLIADIDLSTYSTGSGWAPIGNTGGNGSGIFIGNLDGNGFKIMNLKINRTTTDNVGLFAIIAYSEMKNIILENISVKGRAITGGLVGNNQGTISNSSVTGSVTGKANSGGIVGLNLSTIVNSYAAVSVSGTSEVGGLAGYSQEAISNSYATGSVSGTYNVGGLVGSNAYIISKSYATGRVSGTSDIGGLVGGNSVGTVNNSFYDKNTTRQVDTGKGTGKTSSEMKQITTYTDAGWDLSGRWAINALRNNGYPTLQGVQIYVTYDGNGNTEGVTPFDSSTYLKRATVSVYGNTGGLINSGYSFAGWNTLADGSGITYLAAETFTITLSKTLYAKWMSTAATLTSVIGTISTGRTMNETITDIPYATTLAALKTAITPAANAIFEVYDADGVTPATTLTTGKKVIVTAQDRITKVTYTLTVKSAPDITLPVITLTGNPRVNLTPGASYTDAGATALDNIDGDLTSRIVVTVSNTMNLGTTLDTAVGGTYTYHYNVSDTAGNAAAEVTRSVVVAIPDITLPVITLNGNATVNLTHGASYMDAGATALDNIDGDLTSRIVVTVSNTMNLGTTLDTAVAGTYTFHYNVSDTAGNAAAEVTRSVVVAIPDITLPVITLNGNPRVSLTHGAGYTDAGATALDNIDGNLTSRIVVTVSNTMNLGTTLDTAVGGTYTYHY
ncbi:immunoglobulin-like domain-containing protein, partial [Paenibacillus agricola]